MWSCLSIAFSIIEGISINLILLDKNKFTAISLAIFNTAQDVPPCSSA